MAPAVKRSANGYRPPARKRARVFWRALTAELSTHIEREWFGSGPHRLILSGPKVEALAAHPRDPRPPNAGQGRRILAGTLALDGGSVRIGEAGDPFDTASPTRRFAVSLHRFDWLPDLIAAGPDGARRALRLIDDWRRVFGKWNAFSWGPECLERRDGRRSAEAAFRRGGPRSIAMAASEAAVCSTSRCVRTAISRGWRRAR